MAAVLRVDRLVKRYRTGVTAVKGISFEAHAGDVIGFLGPNGAGKTTTMKMIVNILTPSSGSIEVFGLDVHEEPVAALQHVGALLEVPGIYEYLTPVQLLRYLGRVRGIPTAQLDARIDEMLELVLLTKWKDSKLGGFSTGMGRRFHIASALLHDPDLLVLDEPALGLDPKGLQDVRMIVHDLQKQGKTVLLSSHLLHEVTEMCNRVLMINEGTMVIQDTVEALRNKGDERRLHIELEEEPTAAQLQWFSDLGTLELLERRGPELSFRYHGQRKDLVALHHKVVDQMPVVGFSPESLSLEDLYISVVGKEGGVK